jgi:uncharacterized protein YodC (DUF2158 family)
MDKTFQIGDVVVLNNINARIEIRPQMAVKKVDGDTVTCTFFNPITYSYSSESFHKQQLSNIIG